MYQTTPQEKSTSRPDERVRGSTITVNMVNHRPGDGNEEAVHAHDNKIPTTTNTKPARASCTVRTGLARPLEKCMGTKVHRDNELQLPALSKQRVAMPNSMPGNLPLMVQVRSSWHITLSTTRLHQGSDNPPHPRTSMWSGSCAASIRI